MSTPDITSYMLILEELKKPWSANTFTDTQRRHREDLVRAKELWSRVLTIFHDTQRKTVKKDKLKKNTQPFYPFFDLPPELRNMIYGICLNDEKEDRNPDMSPYPTGWGSRRRYFLNAHQEHVQRCRSFKTLVDEMKETQRNRRVIDDIAKEQFNLARVEKGELTPGTCEAFDMYKLEHDMCALRSRNVPDCGSIFDSCDSSVKKDVVEIDARGNLIDDLPMLSLVNHQLFQETFFLYYSTTREGLWIKWKIRNLDFFPCLRFYHAFIAGDFPLSIPPSRLHIEFDRYRESQEFHVHAKKFSHVKKLVELHWLDGFPLWGCFTGLSDSVDCDGPFGDYMYSVRQIVALYRVSREAWKWHSINLLHKYQEMNDAGLSSSKLTELSDAELVEAIIDMLCKAIEYNLGYQGSFSRIGRNGTEWDEDLFGMFRYQGTYVKVATEKEYETVRIVEQYREKVNYGLRERLGAAYDQWEELPDDAKIPKGVIL
jgi:hypothetical protein